HTPPLSFLFSHYSSRHHRALPSFPTRRSSDLVPHGRPGGRRPATIGGRGPRPDHQRARGTPPGRHEASTPTPLRLSPFAERNVRDRKSTRLNSSHLVISYAVFCLKKKNNKQYK